LKSSYLPPSTGIDRIAVPFAPVRLNIRDQQKAYDQSEEDLKAIQSVGQIIGEVLKQLDDERCESRHPNIFSVILWADRVISTVIVKASSGPRYIVSYRPTLPVAKVRQADDTVPLARLTYHPLAAQGWCPSVA